MTFCQKVDQNQMQFNLNVPVRPSNMAVRFQKPDPIVIEKYTGSPPNVSVGSNPAFSFSSVSEEKLALAVQLAKRDMKQKNFQEQIERINTDKRNKLKSQTGKQSRSKTIKSRVYEDRSSSLQNKTKNVSLRNREKVVSKHSAVHGRSQSPLRNKKTKVTNVQSKKTTQNHNDNTTEPKTVYKTSDERNSAEVKKLRRELYKFLQQIKQARQMAQNGTLKLLRPPKSIRRDEGWLSDEEDEARRSHRADELGSRTSRLLYTSQQQVREVQEGLDKQGDMVLKGDKKTQLLARLASVHRSVVRTMQNFMKYLYDQDSDRNMARVQQELAALIRQLSLCATRLQIAGDSHVPEAVSELLKEAAQMNERLDSHLGSPPSTPKHKKTVSGLQNSPPRKGLTEDQDKNRFRSKGKVIIEKSFPVKSFENKENESRVANRNVYPEPHTIDRLKAYPNKESGASPNREQVLRAGISALLRAANDSPAQRPQKANVQNPRKDQLAWEVSWNDNAVYRRRTAKPAAKKGIIMPTKLKKSNRGRIAQKDVHFADPTVSSMLKATLPNASQLDESWSNTSRSTSVPTQSSPVARDRRTRSASPSATRGRLSATNYQNETDEFRKSMSSQKHDKLSQAEEAIKQRLKPILDKAQEITKAYETLQNHNQNSLRHKLSERTTEKVEMNADILGDMILHDLLEDTVMEMQTLESDEEADQEAYRLQDTPTLTEIYRRMEQMDKEQDEIRRRWGEVTYEDSSRHVLSTRYLDAPYSNRPLTPPALHVSSTVGQPSSLPAQLSRSPVTDAQESAIVFTKSVPQSRLQNQDLHLFGPGNFYRDSANQSKPVHRQGQHKPLPLYLSKDMVHSILDNKAKFESYLKKTSNMTSGKFNPWGLVEEIADEIFSDCLTDIGKELSSVTDDIVTHVYKAEFANPDSQSAQDQSDSQSVTVTEPTTVTEEDY